MHTDFSAAKIEKKVRKLREQIRYLDITIKFLDTGNSYEV